MNDLASPRTKRALCPMELSTFCSCVAAASAMLIAAIATGVLLEELASRSLLGLHKVPLGPNGGADVLAELPAPFGEHGWLPLPLGLLDVALLWSAQPAWRPDSWWAGCHGPVRGLLPQLAVMVMSVLPAVLSAWLLWMPYRCSPLPCGLALVAFAVSAQAALFWSDALPLLPRAHVGAAAAAPAVRRSMLYALQPLYFVVRLALAPTPPPGATAAVPFEGCAALASDLSAAPSRVLETLAEELASHTAQGMGGAGQMLLQLLAACVAIHAVVDVPTKLGGFFEVKRRSELKEA